MDGPREGNKPKLRVTRTISIFLMFFSLGFHEALIGPSFLDLIILYKSDAKTMGVMFLFSAGAYMVGSIICGATIDRINQELAVAVCSFLAGIVVAGSPWIPNTIAFILLFGIFKGLPGGFIDTAGQSYLSGLWTGHKWHDPLMQAIHMMWSVSTTLSPLIIQPFLAERLPDTATVSTNNGEMSSHPNSSYAMNSTANVVTNTTQEDSGIVTHVQYGFLILGGLMFALGFFPLTVFFLAKPTLKALPFTKSSEEAKENEDKWFKIRMLVLIFLFYLCYCAMETIVGGLIATFVVKFLRWDKFKGPLITSVYWGVFGLARVVAIPVSMCCHPRTMLVSSLILALASLLTMVFGSHIHEGITWAAVAVLGFAFGPIFPTTVVWLSKYVVLTGKASAVILIAASISAASFPSLVALLFDSGLYEWMLYIVTGVCTLCIIVFFTMHVYGSRHGELDHAKSRDEAVAAAEQTLELNDSTKPATETNVQPASESHVMLQQDVSV